MRLSARRLSAVDLVSKWLHITEIRGATYIINLLQARPAGSFLLCETLPEPNRDQIYIHRRLSNTSPSSLSYNISSPRSDLRVKIGHMYFYVQYIQIQIEFCFSQLKSIVVD